MGVSAVIRALFARVVSRIVGILSRKEEDPLLGSGSSPTGIARQPALTPSMVSPIKKPIFSWYTGRNRATAVMGMEAGKVTGRPVFGHKRA